MSKRKLTTKQAAASLRKELRSAAAGDVRILTKAGGEKFRLAVPAGLGFRVRATPKGKINVTVEDWGFVDAVTGGDREAFGRDFRDERNGVLETVRALERFMFGEQVGEIEWGPIVISATFREAPADDTTPPEPPEDAGSREPPSPPDGASSTDQLAANAVSDDDAGGGDDPVSALFARARDAHNSIRGDDNTALMRALDAGDALLEAKDRVAHGEWSDRLAETGIPASTARLYMRLARHRDRILAAGCTSIREARELLTDRTSAPRPRRRHSVREHERGGDRYDEGYEAGYLAGSADGYRRGLADGQATAQAHQNGRVELDRRDLRWLVKLAHPDVHGEDALRATRVTQWLTAFLESAS